MITDKAWADEILMSASQTENILEQCGIDVVSHTNTHFLCYCPWHGNTDSPALAVDKEKAFYHCFNPSCDKSGTILEMVQKTKGLNPFQALRLIKKYESSTASSFETRMAEALSKQANFTEFSQDALDRMHEDLSGSVAEEYMHSRGFSSETLNYFRVGYSVKKDMVTVPMHDPEGMPIGLIGRTPSHSDKSFKNSVNLPKSLTAWNFHRARRIGDTVIICEASYDAMRVHQAGYPNVIALLGGHVTSHHLQQINKTFSRVVIMTDFDKKQYRPNCRACNYKMCQGHRPGRDLGRSIQRGLPNKKIMWATFDDKCVYPHGAKDVSDMNDDEIRQCLKNAVSNLEYSMWNIEDQEQKVVA